MALAWGTDFGLWEGWGMGSLEPGRIGVSCLAVALFAVPRVFRYFVLSHNPRFSIAGWDRNLYHHHLNLRLLRISPLFSLLQTLSR